MTSRRLPYLLRYGAAVDDRRAVGALDRVEWMSDLVRLEILLWERLDARLRDRNDMSLAFFEVLHFVRCFSGKSGTLAAWP